MKSSRILCRYIRKRGREKGCERKEREEIARESEFGPGKRKYSVDN